MAKKCHKIPYFLSFLDEKCREKIEARQTSSDKVVPKVCDTFSTIGAKLYKLESVII